MAEPGALLVSLDFELHWGVRSEVEADRCRPRLLRAREAIPKLLQLLADYQIHTTWAVVGLLFFATREDLLCALPTLRPHYADPRLSPYDSLAALGADEAADPCHFAASLLQLISKTPHQEIATHTFSHYYCLEAEQDVPTFRADLAAAVAIAARLGIAVETIVFPRNHICPRHLEAVAEFGLRAYRGETPVWYHLRRDRPNSPRVTRALRFADSYLPLARTQSYRFWEAGEAAPYNLRASRFLRPYSPWLRALEPLRLARVAREMTAAARAREVYHLWWHPEHLGDHAEQNLAALARLARHYRRLHAKWGMESLTMAELAHRLDGRRVPAALRTTGRGEQGAPLRA